MPVFIPAFTATYLFLVVMHVLLPAVAAVLQRPEDFIYFCSPLLLSVLWFLDQMMASFQKQCASFWPGWKEARSTAAMPTTSTPWSSPPTVTSAGWPPRRVSTRRRWKRPRKSSRPLWRASWSNVSRTLCPVNRKGFSCVEHPGAPDAPRGLLWEHTGAVDR